MKSIQDGVSNYQGKRAIVRTNFDVPIVEGKVGDTSRIEDAVKTVRLLLDNHLKIILIAHAGRPNGQWTAKDSLAPIGEVFSQMINEPVVLIPYLKDYLQMKIPDVKVVLLENLRYWGEEETNEDNFARYLASLADIYVNECFATNHREHASFVGIPKYLPSFGGLALVSEVNILTKVRENPERPLVVVIGGAKLETKLPLVKAFANRADKILVGGKLVEEIGFQPMTNNVVVASLTNNKRDITEASAKEFGEIIRGAKTVIWNGTMGVVEEEENALGTKIVAEAINETNAYTILGGGDTEAAATKFNTEGGIDYISSGGGAMLTLLVKGSLVGVTALNESENNK